MVVGRCALGCSCVLVLFTLFIGGTSSAGDAGTFDTLFLVDASSSARDRDKYDLIRKFVVTLSQQLVRQQQHRVAIVSFSGVVYRLNLKLTNDPEQIEKGIKTLNKTGGFSYVTDDIILNMFNKSTIGDGKQVVVVLGRNPENSDAISKTAKSLKSRGLEMFSVGIGPDFFKNTNELRALSSVPLKDHTLRTTYASLLKSSSVMLKKLKSDLPASSIAAMLKLVKHNEDVHKAAAIRLAHKMIKHAPKPHKSARDERQNHQNNDHINHHNKHHLQHRHKKMHFQKVISKSHKRIKTHKTIRSRTRSTPHPWTDSKAALNAPRPFTEHKGPSEAGLMNIIDVTEKDATNKESDASYDRTTTNVATNLLLDYFGSGVSTVGTPSTAHPDMGNLITTNATGGAPSCVGSVPLANRIITNGTMVTGIIATHQNSTMTSTTRACDPSMPLEEGISNGESGIDATWDYGRKK